ncbi:MAG: nucleoside hydrolase [Gammaproteobacteria bacterium]
MKKIILICSIFFLLVSAASAARQFIIDNDAGIDDAIAILYLLNQPNIEVKAITIACDGNAHCAPAKSNIEGLLKLVNKTNIPIATGHSKPVQGHHHFTASVLKESDTLSDAASLLPQHKNANTQTAVDLLITTLKNAQQPMDILAIGPLTNIAEAIAKDPAIKNKIRMIYIMGGAVDVEGNLRSVNRLLKNNLAEWNIYLDPTAADEVFKSGIPLTLVPLDATNQVPVDDRFYQQLKEQAKTAGGKFSFELLKHNRAMIDDYTWYFWDPLAAVIASDESVAKFKMQKLRVVLAPEEKSGALAHDDENGNLVRVCVWVKKEKFKDELLGGLNR